MSENEEMQGGEEDGDNGSPRRIDRINTTDQRKAEKTSKVKLRQGDQKFDR